MNYWLDKNQNAEKAAAITQYRETHAADAIEKSCRETICFDGSTSILQDTGVPITKDTVSLAQQDTVSALFSLKQKKGIVLLDFASYKEPGGQFLEGGMGQEESLCHHSFLYNVLSRHTPFYSWNLHHLNRGLYEDRALLIPSVRFFRDGAEREADVIACAAPNRSFLHHGRFTEEENEEALTKRIQFLSHIFCHRGYHPKIILAGAFGCGAAHQKPETVAELFASCHIPKQAKLIYAVPDPACYEASRKAFENVLGGI